MKREKMPVIWLRWFPWEERALGGRECFIGRGPSTMKTVQAPTAALRFHCAEEDIKIKRHLFQGAHFSPCALHTDTALSKTRPCSRSPAQSRNNSWKPRRLQRQKKRRGGGYEGGEGKEGEEGEKEKEKENLDHPRYLSEVLWEELTLKKKERKPTGKQRREKYLSCINWPYSEN